MKSSRSRPNVAGTGKRVSGTVEARISGELETMLRVES
jgi:hypothetical protein